MLFWSNTQIKFRVFMKLINVIYSKVTWLKQNG